MSTDEIILYHYCIQGNLGSEKIDSLISAFPKVDQKYFYSIHNNEAQKRTLFGRIILKHIALNLGIEDSEFISYSITGKPYFKSQANVDFNISHSRDFVVCCITQNSSVGIDLEFIRPFNIEFYKNCFSSNEWKFISNSKNSGLAFQRLWTRKEAIIKADGRGMEIEMSSINSLTRKIDVESVIWHIQDIEISNDYLCAVACNKLKNIQLVNFNTIFEIDNKN